MRELPTTRGGLPAPPRTPPGISGGGASRPLGRGRAGTGVNASGGVNASSGINASGVNASGVNVSSVNAFGVNASSVNTSSVA